MTQQPITNGALALEIAPRVITIPPNNQSRAKKLRVAAYIRVSTDSDDQLNSFAAQYALRLGYFLREKPPLEIGWIL